ncbi:hemolymph lipopolysaccharide-binding protein-like [Anabrus simplex]|uniref:hemolymph lipopolysaccharide-binding protein-like n=1 Tax=Anabrus simplex TaxID=316456 RepID=UPI0035A2D00E
MTSQLLLFPLLGLLCCILSVRADCGNDISKTVGVSITSRRNLTGHQLIQLEVLRSSGADNTKWNVPWKMDIEQGEKKCSGQATKYLSISIAAQAQLGDDYEFHPLVGRYKLHTTEKSWTEAFNICQQEGAHLVVINSDTEADVLKDILTRNEKAVAFVGVNDIVTEGKFVTIFGEELSKMDYTKWAPNEPNNNGGSATAPGEDCVYFIRDTAFFNDASCTSKHPFICEQELY